MLRPLPVLHAFFCQKPHVRSIHLVQMDRKPRTEASFSRATAPAPSCHACCAAVDHSFQHPTTQLLHYISHKTKCKQSAFLTNLLPFLLFFVSAAQLLLRPLPALCTCAFAIWASVHLRHLRTCAPCALYLQLPALLRYLRACAPALPALHYRCFRLSPQPDWPWAGI